MNELKTCMTNRQQRQTATVRVWEKNTYVEAIG
ncbi:hypothetical protein SAMN05444515_102114 [Ectothiorhodospira marina]|jgi:hypothetical protein|uniref:Uncharacterized protein n=1 Tax=Ectothiorhodospira marina TaxID=1396821 RepID=A0A1H7HAI9_9GAMM|nr:hypothetical protein SAMN05444515_102114 [Ectothiorhodospira marina]